MIYYNLGYTISAVCCVLLLVQIYFAQVNLDLLTPTVFHRKIIFNFFLNELPLFVIPSKRTSFVISYNLI